MTDKVENKKDPLDDEILKFEFTVGQTNAILHILGNAAYLLSAPLIALIQSQGAPQYEVLLKAEKKEAE